MTPKEFNETHRENLRLIASIGQTYLKQWVNDGMPRDKPSEIMKHMWIRISGALERINGPRIETTKK